MEAVPNLSEPASLPSHIAIIMDGNGRWAAERHLPRAIGHKRGAETVRRTVKAARNLGISYLTLFGFSSENWKRPHTEILGLMQLLRFYLRNELEEMMKNGVRLRIIGDRTKFDPDIVSLIEEVEAATDKNTGINLTLALSYGGRHEIVEATRKISKEVAAGKIAAEDISESMFANYLETASIPDPDLIIRTSGEKRISNFLLWQCAYTELVFLDKFWPDFTKKDIEDAVREFGNRERRYGAADS